MSIKLGFCLRVGRDKRMQERITFDFDGPSIEPTTLFSQSWNSLTALKVAGDSSWHIYLNLKKALLVY
jgi:hypothetical protein